jgi:hypothetical protein
MYSVMLFLTKKLISMSDTCLKQKCLSQLESYYMWYVTVLTVDNFFLTECVSVFLV